MDDKLILKYKKKKNENPHFKLGKYLRVLIIKTIIVIVIFVSFYIYINMSNINKNKIEKIIYKSNISFAKIYDIYQKYFNFNLFKEKINDTINVSTTDFKYSKVLKLDNGYLFYTDNNYAAALKSGILVDKKKTNKYNNIITIQDKSGTEITYGYLNSVDVRLYDYVKKDEIIGSITNKLYIKIKKDGKYVSYKNYL